MVTSNSSSNDVKRVGMDEMKQESGQLDASVPVENVPGEARTPVERMTDMARGQASEAAEALRRGEFMHGAELDSAATPDDRLIALLSAFRTLRSRSWLSGWNQPCDGSLGSFRLQQ